VEATCAIFGNRPAWPFQLFTVGRPLNADEMLGLPH
jgi:hypothetical protein